MGGKYIKHFLVIARKRVKIYVFVDKLHKKHLFADSLFVK
jgi:hypothetical protein